MVRRAMLVVLAVALLAPATSHAAYPGANGKIAFVRADDIWTMSPNGAGQVNITNSAAAESEPVWSPDGNQIAFTRGDDIWKMLADGTGQTNVVGGIDTDWGPSWSPDAQWISFARFGRCESGDVGGVYVVSATGGSPTLQGCKLEPGDNRGHASTAWSPDGAAIAFRADLGNFDIFTVPTTPPGPSGPHAGTNLTTSAADFFDFAPNWSPDNTKIAWDTDRDSVDQHIWKMNPDGSSKARITTATVDEEDPAWSPDGTKIAYRQAADIDSAGIYIANVNGTGRMFITDGLDPDWQPLNQPGPEADVLSIISDSPDPVAGGGILTYTAQAKNLVGPDDASGTTLTVNLPANTYFISASASQGSCSHSAGVVTCNVGALPVGSSATATIQVEPMVPLQGPITANANATATELDPVPGNNASATTTTVTPGGYIRPQGAHSIRLALVPAYRQCDTGAATLQHGSPLAHPSCGSPALTSGYLTLGSGPANSAGFVRITELGEGPPINTTNGDQADVAYQLQLTDVRKASDLTDYTGELQVQATLRLTDRDNSPSGNAPATLDTAIAFNAPCTATGGAVGATCNVSTSAEAVIAGSVKEAKRAVWALGKLRVLDGGADGDAETGPNTLFAVQGLFAP